MLYTAEYIWLDGDQPTQRLRSRTRVLHSSRLDGPGRAKLAGVRLDLTGRSE